MGFITKIGAKVVSSGSTYAKEAAAKITKMARPKPKMAQKVNIVSDEFTQIPGVLNLTTGTKTFRDIGGGIRVVQPGPQTKLGQLGIEQVTTYPKGFWGNESALYALQFRGAKKPAPCLMDKNEFKSTLDFVQEMKRLANSPAQKLQNAWNGFIEYFAS